MNYCWFTLKFAQFFISALIGILFLVPAGLVVNEGVLINEDHGSNVSETVLGPKHLICSVLNYDFADATPEYLGTASYVIFPEIDPQSSNVSQFDHVRRALGCLQYYTDGDKSDCLCWGWDKPIIIFAVGVAAFTAGTSLCDMVSIWAAEGQDARTTWIQGLGSCICSGTTGVIWIVVGILITYFGFAEWPFVYYNADMSEVGKFFKIPTAWYLGLALCFSFAMIMLMEGYIYLGESGKGSTVENSHEKDKH